MKEIRVIIIGVGPHAKRIYIPSLLALRSRFNVRVCLAVELKGKEKETSEYFESLGIKVPIFFVEPFFNKIPHELTKRLNDFVKNKSIDGVIISTEPLVHKSYAEWALVAGLHILMDKPITTRKNVVSSSIQARGIYKDYKELLNAYEKLQERKQTIFTINVQRRYHPGFQLVTQKLSEVALETNCPVTSVQSSHCDGQWRLPGEIVTQGYHPYNIGYGKASHSGYHVFDAIYQFYKTSKLTGKIADSMSVVSSFVQPRGFLYQLNELDYERYFGDEYKRAKTFTDKELMNIYRGFGEIDVAALVSLKKNGENIANITINLMHNGFARRDWIRPGTDLYKGNGRVKHEYHNIEQGPFQNIQIHSYQSNDRHDKNTEDDYLVGGNNHFDIYVFRNIGVLGGSKPLEIIKMSDIASREGFECTKLAMEQVKSRVVLEFLEYISGEINKEGLVSNIDDHLFPVQLMSLVYESHIKRSRGRNGDVSAGLSI